MITTASPSTWSRPAVNAIWWPKLREKLTPLTRASRAARSLISAHERSREPSSTSTISYERTVPLSTSVSRRYSSGTLSSSL